VSQSIPANDADAMTDHARRVWETVMARATGPLITLADAASERGMEIAPGDAGSALGWVTDLTMYNVISECWPALDVPPTRAMEERDEISKYSLGFRQLMSARLRTGGNCMCLVRGNPSRASTWWVRSRWNTDQSVKVRVNPLPPDDPRSLEIRLEECRRENQRLATELRKQLLISRIINE